MKKYKLAIVGATGLVGRTALKILEEKNIQNLEYTLFSSKKSAGTELKFMNTRYLVHELKDFSFDEHFDFAIFSAGAETSRHFAPIAASKGCVVIDNSSAFRMDDDVPLIVPEVNFNDVINHKNIIANPNCSTIQAVVALKPLDDKYKIKEPLECLIQEIKDKIDVVTGRYYRLSELRKNLVEKNRLTSEKDRLTQEIKILREELEEASKKSSNDILIFEKWKTLYEDIFKEIFSQTCSVSISSEDYMPIINDNTMNRISSESMKLVARLSYVLSLYKLQSYLENDIVNSVGLVIFDSPKDKDLDNDKYRKFLKIVADNSEGQVFLTGSVMEREIYEEAFDKGCFFNFLTEDDRLLKNRPCTDE